MSRSFKIFSRVLLALFALLISTNAMATEEPKYTSIASHETPYGTIELREYEPIIIAETLISGSMDEASRKGFKRIADYIFGNNTMKSGSNTKIAMTAPVIIEPYSQLIDMTAPVTMEQQGGQWRMHFVMPSEHTMETLPKPNNPEVKLRIISKKKYAVISFSGLAGEAKVAKQTAVLSAWLQQKNIIPKGSAELARYNPPWTLPFLRRNEIMMAY